MAMEAGDALKGTGLAGALQTAIKEELFGDDGFPTAEAKRQTAKFNDALATALIDYIKTNMEVIIKSSDAGLQREVNGMVTQDTLGPSKEKTLKVR